MLTYDYQPGPQRLAARSAADVIFFGGAKGGGKSVWGLRESAKWFDKPKHNSLIFRRTSPELRGPGSLWEECSEYYRALGGTPTASKMEYTFASGSTVHFRHLQYDSDADAYNGRNIGDVLFEELPYFTEHQFWTILSCQRALSGSYAERPRIRATMNPDPNSWVMKFVEWYLDDAGFADDSKSGVIRWFGRRDGELSWYDNKEAALADGIDLPKSFTFISSKIWDNPILLKARPEYLANLKALPPVQQARFLGGNWKVREQAGDYFREEWFPIRKHGVLDWHIAGHPHDLDIVYRFRVWDLAGTPWAGDTVRPGTLARSQGKAPDWTRGGLFGLTRKGSLILLDMVSWRDSPGEIEAAMIDTHLRDGRLVHCVVGHDPGQAGNYQMEAMAKNLRKGAKIRTFAPVRATKGKTEYAAVASEMAYNGRIFIQEGRWNRAFFSELEAFPSKDYNDDQVDVLSQAVAYAKTLQIGKDLLETLNVSRGQAYDISTIYSDLTRTRR